MSSVKSFVLIATLFVASTSFAAAGPKIQSLQSGTYKVQPGSEEICDETIRVKHVGNEEIVAIGRGLNVSTATTTVPNIMKSDINPKCSFVENSIREDSSGTTVVTQTNREVCGRQIRSESLTRFTFTEGTIKVELEEKGVPSSKCVWALSTKN